MGVAKKPAPKKSKIADAKPAAAPPEAIAAPRPRPLGELAGQERAIGVLRGAMKAGRVQHCWVFHGPAGVGKFTSAVAFAAVLLDPTSRANITGDVEPDPESPTQRLLNSGTHPDLRIITKELARFSSKPTVRVQKLRAIAKDVLEEFLLEPASRTASVTRDAMATKVFIIDEADLLQYQSQNSLLKMLEEPPAGTVFILVTSQPDRLLPTIRSRSQMVFFGPLPPEAMAKWVAGSGNERSGEEGRWLLAFAAGSPGVYQAAAEGGLFGWAQRLEPLLEQADAGRYPLELGGVMAELVGSWAEAWVNSHANASKEAANQAAADWLMRLLAQRYRERLRASPGPPSLAPIDALRRAESELDANVNMLFVMDHLAAELAAR